MVLELLMEIKRENVTIPRALCTTKQNFINIDIMVSTCDAPKNKTKVILMLDTNILR